MRTACRAPCQGCGGGEQTLDVDVADDQFVEASYHPQTHTRVRIQCSDATEEFLHVASLENGGSCDRINTTPLRPCRTGTPAHRMGRMDRGHGRRRSQIDRQIRVALPQRCREAYTAVSKSRYPPTDPASANGRI